MGVFDFLKKDMEYNSGGLFSDDLIMATQIRKNLEYVCQKNIHLIVAIDERPSTFSSIFLDVGGNNEYVIIDILMPEHGNQFIKNSKKVRIDYSIEGIMYYFETKFIEVISGKFPSIKVTFPSIIRKVQRRKYFRVSPSIDHPINVKLSERLDERVADISEGGLAFYSRLTERDIAIGVVFERTAFKLPSTNQNIITRLTVRNLIKGMRENVKNRFGVEFVDMRLHDRDIIASYVLTRQREIIQKQNI